MPNTPLELLVHLDSGGLIYHQLLSGTSQPRTLLKLHGIGGICSGPHFNRHFCTLGDVYANPNHYTIASPKEFTINPHYVMITRYNETRKISRPRPKYWLTPEQVQSLPFNKANLKKAFLFAGLIKKGKTFPPVHIWNHKGTPGWDYRDGRCRVLAAKMLGLGLYVTSRYKMGSKS